MKGPLYFAKRHRNEVRCQKAGRVATVNRVEDEVSHLLRRFGFFVRVCVRQRTAFTKASPHASSLKIVEIFLNSIPTNVIIYSDIPLLMITRTLVVFYRPVTYFRCLASTLQRMVAPHLRECLM